MSLQAKIDPSVNEALPEMAVKRAEITVLIQERSKIAQVFSNVVRRNRGIFPAFPRIRLVRHPRARAQASITNFPDHRLVRRIVDQLHLRRVRLRLQLGHQLFGRRVCFFPGLPAKLDQEPAFAFGQNLQITRVNVLDLHRLDRHIVNALEPDWSVFAHERNVIASLINIRITEDQERACRRIDNQFERCLQNHNTGAFRADERTPNVKVLLRQ